MTRIAAALAIVAGLAPGLAAAQQRQAAPAAAPPPAAQAGEAGPDRTSAVFGDWVVQCATVAPGRRLCEMVQIFQDQRQQPVAVISVGRTTKDQPLKFHIRVPANVLLTTAPRLVLEGSAGDPQTMTFTRCAPAGCFAERDLGAELLRRLRGRPADQGAKVSWRDSSGHDVTLNMSFRGFSAAYEALVKEGG